MSYGLLDYKSYVKIVGIKHLGEYIILAENNEYVLVRLLKGNNRVEFVTWRRDTANHHSVSSGNYFTNIIDATADFVKRSGYEV